MRISGNPELFHTGAIVDDIERAMDDMTHAFGAEWCAPSKGGRTEVWTPAGWSSSRTGSCSRSIPCTASS